MIKAHCPGCGADITFQSSVSIMAVCEHCNSTLVRRDVDIEAVGKMATLQVDGSPLQLGAGGDYRGAAFTVVGRIQLRFDRGIWNEWHLLFSDGRSGWLGEAQGTYAVSFLAESAESLPGFDALEIGKTIQLRGESFRVENIESTRCIGGQGELPFKVAGGYEAPVADLLGDKASFATIDYSEDEPLLFVGRYVDFDELRLTNLREFDSWTNATAPRVKSFTCIQCGGAVTQRALMQTTSVVCPSCGSVIDVTDDNLKLISAYNEKTKVKPDIPIGSRGKFQDGTFEVIGFMRRFVTVEGVPYRWREYLLFNPFKGFRWLSEYNGHWSYIKSTPYRPTKRGSGDLEFRDRIFQHFQSATAKVDYVIGEFYWRVEYGESCLVQDFVSPPQILSLEQTDKEIAYSLGRYVEPEEIRQAFQLTTPLPPRIGVGANQPSVYTFKAARAAKLAALFIGVAFLIQMAALALSQDRLVYQTSLAFNTADAEKSRVSDIFEIKGRPSNVMVRTNANVNNSWVYLSMALINDDTGTAYDFGRELSYYSGTDSDGAWTEGSRSDEAFLSSIPAGHYYLRIEPEGSGSTSYSVQVYRDVPRWWLFFVTVGLLLLPPLFLLVMSRSFEYKRWSESDHPMSKLINANSGDDDE
jgi:Domain of unknown function (DUF4178)